jgi:hypothetical protein
MQSRLEEIRASTQAVSGGSSALPLNKVALVVLNCLVPALLPVSRCCVSNCTLCQAQAAVQSTTQFGIASAAPLASQPLVPLVGGAGAATVGAGAATVTSPSAETIAEVTTSITNPEAMKKSDTSSEVVVSEVVVPTNFQLPVLVSSFARRWLLCSLSCWPLCSCTRSRCCVV